MGVKLGVNLGYWGIGPAGEEALELVLAAERLGYESVWVAESYGSDVTTVLAWLAGQTKTINLGAAIMQVPARPPAAAAMAGATIDKLSGGRFLFGFGPSGPQVSEGWYGVPYAKPWGRTREYIEVVREIIAREGPLEHHGTHYDLPLEGGEGKALKLNFHPLRNEIPVFVGAIGRKSVEMAAEVADGWIPIFFSVDHLQETWGEHLEAGFAKAGRTRADLEVSPSLQVAIDGDLEAARNMVKAGLLLYLGGMGSRKTNFYVDLAHRFGFGDVADEVQRRFQAGDRGGAFEALPDEIVAATSLVGTEAEIADRVARFAAAGVDRLIVSPAHVERDQQLHTLERLAVMADVGGRADLFEPNRIRFRAAVKIGVPKETAEGERRVALVPDVVRSLKKNEKVDVLIESGAGEAAGHPDAHYTDAGAEIAAADAIWNADVVLRVAVPSAEDVGRLSSSQIYISHLNPWVAADTNKGLAASGVTAFAMEAIPRTTRAQAMDALSSQAAAAGYAAMLIAARESGRFFGMMTTAAGTVPPAKVLVLGAGVAGLQAVATAKRLGAIVTGFDIRRAAWEQIASLGGRPLELDFIPDAEGEGGYARPLTDEENAQVRDALADNAKKQDIIVTTAAIPGRPAPTLITADAVRGMQPGSVIVDLAAETGGNTS